MDKHKYFLVSGIIFGLVSLLHFIRAFNGWQFQIDSWILPQWISWCAFVAAGFMCATAFRLKKN